MKQILIMLLLITSGCASSREITELKPYLSDEELENPNNHTIDKVKQYYFTEEAYQAIKNIPAIGGPAIGGYAAGVNFWANAASFMTCNGWGRKIIISNSLLSKLGVEILIHEYVHHLDDLDRDGEHEFIDHEEFKIALEMLKNDMHWKGLYIYSMIRRNLQFVADIFGVGELSEQIAYIANKLITVKGPEYIKYVYRKILKVKYSDSFVYYSTDGKITPMTINDLKNEK